MASYAEIMVSLEDLDIIELEIIRDIIDDLAPPRAIIKARVEPDYAKERRRLIEHALTLLKRQDTQSIARRRTLRY